MADFGSCWWRLFCQILAPNATARWYTLRHILEGMKRGTILLVSFTNYNKFIFCPPPQNISQSYINRISYTYDTFSCKGLFKQFHNIQILQFIPPKVHSISFKQNCRFKCEKVLVIQAVRPAGLLAVRLTAKLAKLLIHLHLHPSCCDNVPSSRVLIAR